MMTAPVRVAPSGAFHPLVGRALPLRPSLGEDADPIVITRDLAQALQESIEALISDPGDPDIYTREACWRDLRSRRWGVVMALQNKASAFLASKDEALAVSREEWESIESVIECVETIGSLERQSTESTIGLVGTLIGVAGGIATLVALL